MAIATSEFSQHRTDRSEAERARLAALNDQLKIRQPYIDKAQTLYNAGRLVEARKAAELALVRFEELGEVYARPVQFLLAEISLSQGNYRVALEILTGLKGSFASSTFAPSYALALARSGSLEAARRELWQHFDSAYSSDDVFRHAASAEFSQLVSGNNRSVEAAALAMRGDADNVRSNRAIEDLRVASRHYPSSKFVSYLLARAYARTKKWELAEQELARVHYGGTMRKLRDQLDAEIKRRRG